MASRLAIKPMLCKNGQMIPASGSDWTMEPKLDGWRFVFDIDTNHQVRAYTRRELRLGGADVYRMPAVTSTLARLFPPDTILDAEVVVIGTGKQSTDVATALARSGELRAVVFDVLRLAGHDVQHLPWHSRRHLLNLALGGRKERHVALIPSVKPSQRLLDRWLDQGLEGAVIKRRDSRYQGRRSRDWLKLKPQSSIDLVITGFVAGGGKFDGQIGAVTFEYNGKTGRASGMNDATRRDMTEHPERYVGRLAEFAYHGPTTNGHLRHPQYKRLRDDV